MPSNLTCPPTAIQRDGLSRIAGEALVIRAEPCALLRVWSRSPNADADDPEAWLPTNAAIAIPSRDVPELIALLEAAAREVGA